MEEVDAVVIAGTRLRGKVLIGPSGISHRLVVMAYLTWVITLPCTLVTRCGPCLARTRL